VYFPEDGTVYFRPRRSYRRVQPRVSKLTRERDVLAELCAQAQIKVNAWMVLNHNTRLGLLHPELCVRNCYGDAYPYSLCPAQAEVRHHAVTLTADLAEHYAVAALLLETPGFLGYAHGFHHEFAQLACNAWLDTMLSLCFCSACIAGASACGIDAEALRRRIAERIDRVLNEVDHLDPRWAKDRLALDREADPELAALHAWRAQTVTSLVAEIRAAVRANVQVKVISTTQPSHRTAYVEGGDLGALERACDGLEAPLYQASTALIEKEALWVGSKVRRGRLSAILRPGFPDMGEEAQLRAAFRKLKKIGIGDVSFYNYGMLKRRNLEWIGRLLLPRS
jgi:hypothetical protein